MAFGLSSFFSFVKTVVLMAIAAVVGFYVGSKYFPAPASAPAAEVERATVDVSIIKRKLEQISELATVNYSYTDIAKHEKSEKLWGMKVPFSTSSILLQYGGEIKAGIDLGKAQIDVVDTTVYLFLPHAKVMSNSIDPGSVKILNQSNGLFSSINVADYNAFCAAHRDSIETQAIREGLLTRAEEGALSSLWLITMPLEEQGFNVKVEYRDSIPNVQPEPSPAQVTDNVK